MAGALERARADGAGCAAAGKARKKVAVRKAERPAERVVMSFPLVREESLPARRRGQARYAWRESRARRRRARRVAAIVRWKPAERREMSGLVVMSTENVSAVAGLRSLPGARPRTSISHVPSFGDTLRTFRRPLPGSGVSGDSVADSAEPPPKYMTSRAFFSSEVSGVVTRKLAFTVTRGRSDETCERSDEKSRNFTFTPSMVFDSPFLRVTVVPSMRAGWPGS